ncbi:hypothetical protein [Aurantimonas sp. A3-2-R12]|uniref:hypothetical protein n=1 Tax=Aurantimonas sp. A3-2-R12 TaxID=3114362 RepID=UPI002E194365|nr:hypothetical protein [Aurantimonas sp. A3-2-R12]
MTDAFRAVIAATFLTGPFAATTPAIALTGAELMQDGRFTEGYAWGVVAMMTGIVVKDDDHNKLVFHYDQCLRSSKINSRVLLDGVQEFIERNPKNLALPAFFPVLNFLGEMCGSPDD